MGILSNEFKIDSSEAKVFRYTKEEELILTEEAKIFERNQVVAEHKAIEAAQALILTD